MRHGWALLALCLACGEAARPAAIGPVVARAVKEPDVALERTSDQGARIVLARLEGRTVIWLADEDEQAIRAFDAASGAPIAETPLDGSPAQMVVDDEGRLLVALRDRAQVIAMRATRDATLRFDGRWHTADEPIALALHQGSVLVASGWAGRLEGIRLGDGVRWLDVAVGSEPRALAVVGGKAYVAHARDSRLATVKLEGAEMAWVSFDSRFHAPRPMPMARRFDAEWDWGRSDDTRLQARHGVAAMVDGTRLIVPHTLEAVGEESSSSGYGGGGRMDGTTLLTVSIVDTRKDEIVTAFSRTAFNAELGRRGCPVPGSAVTAKGTLFVTCLGKNVVEEIPLPFAVHKREWPVPDGPTAMAFDAERDRLIVFSQIGRALSLVPLAEGEAIKVPLPGSRFEEHARGRHLFFASGDPRISRDGRACATCHIDGRDDGLTWSTPEGPRRTPMLAGRVSADRRFGWRKQAASIHEHLASTFRNLEGTGLQEADEAALVAWVKAMPPPPTSRRPLDAGELRGRAIFESAETGCASCHGDKTELSDHETHDVKSADWNEQHRAFGTPSLRYLARRGPYFHTGKYGTLSTLLRETDGQMGSTKHLGEADLQALVAYLSTL